MSMASVSRKNNAEVRHLVLRKVCVEQHILTFWTDIRSPKIESLQENNKVALSAFNDSISVQVGCTGYARIHHRDDVTDTSWQQATDYNKRAYCQLPPGQVVDRPFAGQAIETSGKASAKDMMCGYENFAVITIAVKSLDYLHLTPNGNSRAHFTYGETSELVSASWLS